MTTQALNMNTGITGHGVTFSFSVKDPGSAATHFIGAAATVIAAPFMITHYINQGADALSLFGVCIFLLSMFLLYSASTTYHTVITTPGITKILKKCDHLMIFVLIAGTYTPICLTVLRGTCGWWLLAAVWGVAFAGGIFKFFWVTCPKWVSSVLYIGMGWLCVFAFPQIFSTMPMGGFYFLLAGGIVYTVGGVIYALKLPIFNTKHPYFGSHEIFHLFVMGGSLLQYITIYYYLV